MQTRRIPSRRGREVPAHCCQQDRLHQARRPSRPHRHHRRPLLLPPTRWRHRRPNHSPWPITGRPYRGHSTETLVACVGAYRQNRDESTFAALTEADWAQINAGYQAYIKELNEAGVFVATDYLKPSAAGTTVTLRSGTLEVKDGPYADTKEQLGGYFVIEVPDLDAAIAWAQKCPVARFGIIEIRPSAL